jgi:hypothetical protein
VASFLYRWFAAFMPKFVGFIAALAFHWFIVIRIERLAGRIDEYGDGLVRRIGRGFPTIDYADPRIPIDLKRRFRYLNGIWIIGQLILMSPLAAYLILRKLGYLTW